MELKRYRKVNRIKQFNFQINRVLTYGKEACDEELVIRYLSDVRTLEEWYGAWTELSAMRKRLIRISGRCNMICRG